ncbi:MAG: HAD family hydrolase [Firmicutes bacterium]|nr:HAD family hydrolase [Bacillota bacterium]
MAEWVTFDLDGTLADSPFERIVMPWLVASLEKSGIAQARQRLSAEQLKRFAAGQRVAGFHWDDIAAALMAEVGCAMDEDIVAALKREPLAEQARAFPLYEDVAPALASLRERGYLLGVVTNGHARYQQALFALMGVEQQFALMLGPDIVGCAKPDPAIFSWPPLAGQVRMHVGDLLTQDIRAAREAGIPAVLVVRAGQEQTAKWAQALRSLAQVPARQRPSLALSNGWLDDMMRRESAYLGRPEPATGLTQGDVHVPDAMIFSFSELLALLPPT